MRGERAACCPTSPQILSSSSPSPFLPLDSLARENPSCGAGAATERRAIKGLYPERLKPPDPRAEDLQEAGGATSVPGDSPVFIGGTVPLGLADAVMYEVEPPCVDAHERGGALPVGAAPALADNTAGVETAGEVEKAAAARPDALMSWAQDQAARGREVESLPRGGKVMYEPPPEALPPEGWRNHEPPPQKGERNKRRCHESASASVPKPRANTSPVGSGESRRAKTSYPLGKDQALEIQKGQPESKSSARKGMLRPRTSYRASTPYNKRHLAARRIRGRHHQQKDRPRTFSPVYPCHISPPRAPAVEERLVFISRPIERAPRRPWTHEGVATR